MAPAEKKKGSAKSKSKAVTASQKTILELFAKKKDPISEADGSQSGGENIVVDVDGSEVAMTSSNQVDAPSIQPSTQKENGAATAQHHDNLTSRQTTPSRLDEVVIDITDDEAPSIAGPSQPPLQSAKVPSKLTIRLGPSSQARSNGGTRHEPIVLGSSPVKAESTKPAYSIFAPRKAKLAVQATKQQHGHSSQTFDAPYPSSESQHVRGLQGVRQLRPSCPEPRVRPNGIIDIDEISPELTGFRERILDQDDYFEHRQTRAITRFKSTELGDYVKSIPIEHAISHPIIEHMLRLPASSSTKTTSTSSQELWADKWRPRRAEHVLNNERHAIYLRDWLCSLELQLETRVGSPKKSVPALAVAQDALEHEKSKVDQGVKRSRPQVVRDVAKQRGRKKQRINSDDEEDWIVNSCDEDELVAFKQESEESEGDMLEYTGPRMLHRLRRKGSSPNPATFPNTAAIDSDLHNTMLLAGPSGSGKTAAVYACAKEMGWEVFEVYPGVGKRNRVSLDQLIGEVGKNHLVRKGAATEKAEELKDNFASKFGKKNNKKKVVESDIFGVPMDVEALGPQPDRKFVSSVAAESESREDQNHSQKPEQAVHQSLILLEEVDILFEEDRGFWLAVINIIKECRRPVVMTCNDISCVPFFDLPLQDTLTFESPSPSLATSYLQTICFAEGRLVGRNSLLELCGSVYPIEGFELPDSPFNPLTTCASKPNLRQAIHQLQLSLTADNGLASWASTTKEECLEELANCWTVEPQDKETGAHQSAVVLRGLYLHAEAMSFVDSYLARSPLDTREALAFNDHVPCLDDEIGHTHLYNSSGASLAPPYYHADEMIYEDTIRYSRTMLDGYILEPATPTLFQASSSRALFRARVEYQSQILDVLWPKIIPLQSHLLPRPAVFLDYIPWIRNMVLVDDGYETTGGWDADVNSRTRRPTRSTARTAYERQLTLSDTQRLIIAMTAMK